MRASSPPPSAACSIWVRRSAASADMREWLARKRSLDGSICDFGWRGMTAARQSYRRRVALDRLDRAMATASPPPMHSDAIPRFRFRRASAWMSVVRMRAPVAPIGMAERAGAAVHVDARMVDVHIAHRRHGHGRERLVDLVEIRVAGLPAELGEQRLDRADRSGREPLRLVRVARVAEDARERLEAARFRSALAHDDQRGGAIRDGGGAGGSDRAVLARTRASGRRSC